MELGPGETLTRQGKKAGAKCPGLLVHATTGIHVHLKSAWARLILAANGTAEQKTVHPYTVLPAP